VHSSPSRFKSGARNHLNLLFNALDLKHPWGGGVATTFTEHEDGFHARGRDAEPCLGG